MCKETPCRQAPERSFILQCCLLQPPPLATVKLQNWAAFVWFDILSHLCINFMVEDKDNCRGQQWFWADAGLLIYCFFTTCRRSHTVIPFGLEQGKMAVKWTRIFKYCLPSAIERVVSVLGYMFFKIVLGTFRSFQRGQGTHTFFKISLKTWISG